MPGILRIPLVFPRAEMTRDQRTLRKLIVILVAIEIARNLIDDANQVDDCTIVYSEVVGVHGGKAEYPRIKAAAASGGRSVQVERIDEAVVEIGSVGSAHVVDQPNIGSELKRVLAFAPGDDIHPVMHRNVELGGKGSFRRQR